MYFLVNQRVVHEHAFCLDQQKKIIAKTTEVRGIRKKWRCYTQINSLQMMHIQELGHKEDTLDECISWSKQFN